jgi:hypothetical protein
MLAAANFENANTTQDKSKTSDLNPIVISNALNLTLNCMVDVMERTLDVTAVNTTPSLTPPTTSIPPPSIVTSPIESPTAPLLSTLSQSLGPLPASLSTTEILDQSIRIISANDSPLSEDELLSALLFFTSASEDAIHAA